uniref:Telomere repeat-binding protein 5-like n=1 Tax=Rhizophora mucronata TaxID=61149 RepID=A0A2P2JKM8_RHIMU
MKSLKKGIFKVLPEVNCTGGLQPVSIASFKLPSTGGILLSILILFNNWLSVFIPPTPSRLLPKWLLPFSLKGLPHMFLPVTASNSSATCISSRWSNLFEAKPPLNLTFS